MKRNFYLGLAASGLRMPIGTDLVLREQPDPEAVLQDGRALGEVIEAAARRYGTPLALLLMDLQLEKSDLLDLLDHGQNHAEAFHFDEPPSERDIERARGSAGAPFSRRNQAHIDAVKYIAERGDLVPVGISV